MVKPAGPGCNLDCRYCYYLSKSRLYEDPSARMGLDLLERFTRQYIEAQRVPEVSFVWQGGEPTLAGLEFFKEAVALQRKYQRPGQLITNAIQTNATLLDDDWCRFFHEHDFLVGVSLDGPAALNDRYRVDRAGNGTFKRVMAGLELLNKHEVEFNILATVNAGNADHPLEVYRFLRDEADAQYIQFIPIVQRKNDTGFQEGFSVTRRSVSGKKYGQFLAAVFDEWLAHDVGRVFVQIFDSALASWVHQPAALCIFSEVCGTAMVLEYNGDLYACDHFVEPSWLLGNLDELSLVQMAGSALQQQFGAAKRDALPDECLSCDVRFACNGGCPKNRIRRASNGQEGLNYLCEGYRTFFHHIKEPMDRMAAAITTRRSPPRLS